VGECEIEMVKGGKGMEREGEKEKKRKAKRMSIFDSFFVLRTEEIPQEGPFE